MQPLIFIAIVAVAAIGMSSGFLLTGTTFNLTAQDLGAKETDLKSPITNARVDFVVKTVPVQAAGHTAYRNVIDKCSFHSDSNIPRSGVIICKLTKNHDIVAEGRLDLTSTGYRASDRTFIPLQHFAYAFSNDVQNINDVKIIVLGKNPTCDYNPATALPLCTLP